MAVNYSSVAEKVFKVLKGSGLNIQMFDAQDGTELSNPEQSRFFYVADPNLMVNLDDKNQELKVHKGPENIAVLSDLLKSLKNLAKDNLLDFDLREFGREIKPKNYTYRLNSNKVSEEMDNNMDTDQQEMNTTAKLRDAVKSKLDAPVLLHPRNTSQSEFDPEKVTKFRDKDAKIAFRLSDLAARAHDDEISVYLARMSDKFSGNDPEGWADQQEKNTDIQTINSILKKIEEPKKVANAESTNSELPELKALEEAFNELTGTDLEIDEALPQPKDDSDAEVKDIAKRVMSYTGSNVDRQLSYDKWLKQVKGIERGANGISGDEHAKYSKEWRSYKGIPEGITLEGGNAWDMADTEAKETIENSGSEQEALQGLEQMLYSKPKDADEHWANDIINDYIKMIKTQGFDKVQAGVERANWEPEMPESKGTDHDKDGDIDSDDYLASRDKAIKKAMGKEEAVEEDDEFIARLKELSGI